MASRKFHEGDRVRWDHSQGTSKGKVVDVATSPGEIKDFHYEATEDDPKYIVKSDDTGALAAHGESELRRA